MKLKHAIGAIPLLPDSRDAAITKAEFVDRWRRAGLEELSDRQLHRFLTELESHCIAGEVSGPNGSLRYFRASNRASEWAMTQETALRLLLTSRMLAQTMQGVGNEGAGLIDFAESVISTSLAGRRLHRKIRVVPDGIGRLPAKVAPGVQEAVVESIASARQLRIVYRSRAQMGTGGQERTHDLTVLGAVSKDGAIYLLATKGLTEKVLTYALHRVAHAEVLSEPALERPDFDLDDHIEKTHQLSHGFDDNTVVDLRLRVHKGSIWHLQERPLCAQQKISRNPDANGWYAVTAPIPNTELLVPALLSMGDWVIVDGPDVVREKLVARLHAAAGHYPASPRA